MYKAIVTLVVSPTPIEGGRQLPSYTEVHELEFPDRDALETWFEAAGAVGRVRRAKKLD